MIDRSRLHLSNCILVALLALTPLLQGQESSWPLVKSAQALVRGTVRSIDNGVEDRLLVIDTSTSLVGENLLSVVEPAGLLSERSGIEVGTSGLFLLLGGPLDERSEFPTAASELLPGGFLRVIPDDLQIAAIDTLRQPKVDPAARHGALSLLLLSGSVELNLLALGALGSGDESTDGELVATLTASLGSDMRRDAAILEVALQRGWSLTTEDLALLYLDSDNAVVSKLALDQIERHGGADDHARLLLAWTDADLRGRIRLLAAYRQLRLPESDPWWTQALVSDDPRLVAAAVRGLGEARIPGAQEKYQLLLESSSPRLRLLALEGLARTATRGAFDMLQEFESGLSSSPEDLSLKSRAGDLLKNPWKALGDSPGTRIGGGW